MTEETQEGQEGPASPSIEELFQVVQAHHSALQGIATHLMQVAGRLGEVEAVLAYLMGEEQPQEEGGSSPQADGH